MQKIQKSNNLICLSGEVDFHRPCYTTDGKFEITYHGNDKFSIRSSSENINNKYIKKFKELSPKVDDLSIDEINDILEQIYGKD